MIGRCKDHVVTKLFRLGRLLGCRERVLKTSAGSVRIRLPRPSRLPSFYLFALHKSGSTLLNNMMQDAIDCAGISSIALSEVAFSAGLPESDIINPEDFIYPVGYCYRGFREFPPYLRGFDISRNKKILLVRDPRDMLVSNFFSVKFSHTLPADGVVRRLLERERELASSMSIDQYCRSEAALFKAEFDGYRPILGTEIRIFRYEDIIFNKREWLGEMLAYLEIALPPDAIERIVRTHDIVPDTERAGEHVRQVTPGNYKKHLNSATVSELNHRFSEILSKYRYHA